MSNPIEGLLTKEQTDLIFNNMSDGVIMVNEEGIITYMNSASAAIFHIDAEDAIQKPFNDIFLQNKKNRAFNKLFRSSMEKGQLTEKNHGKIHVFRSKRILFCNGRYQLNAAGKYSDPAKRTFSGNDRSGGGRHRHTAPSAARPRLCLYLCRTDPVHQHLSGCLEPVPLHTSCPIENPGLYYDDRSDHLCTVS